MYSLRSAASVPPSNAEGTVSEPLGKPTCEPRENHSEPSVDPAETMSESSVDPAETISESSIDPAEAITESSVDPAKTMTEPLHQPSTTGAASEHVYGTTWFRCACGFTDNAWAVAGHRGRHISRMCASEPVTVRPEDLIAIRATLGQDLLSLEEWTCQLLSYFLRIRKSDLAVFSFDDITQDGDLRVRRTGRLVSLECIDDELYDHNMCCPRCHLGWYLDRRFKEKWGSSGLLFPHARRHWRPLL
jgi:hypothetical protein